MRLANGPGSGRLSGSWSRASGGSVAWPAEIPSYSSSESPVP